MTIRFATHFVVPNQNSRHPRQEWLKLVAITHDQQHPDIYYIDHQSTPRCCAHSLTHLLRKGRIFPLRERYPMMQGRHLWLTKNGTIVLANAENPHKDTHKVVMGKLRKVGMRIDGMTSNNKERPLFPHSRRILGSSFDGLQL